MTIAAGFSCPEGVVLCADTQESYGSFLKRSQPKIVIKPDAQSDEDECRAVFAGAGDSTFTDMLIGKVWQKMAAAGADEAAVVEALEDEILAKHQRTQCSHRSRRWLKEGHWTGREQVHHFDFLSRVR